MRRRRGRISNTKPTRACNRWKELRQAGPGRHGDGSGTRTKKMTGGIGGGEPKRAG